MLSFCILLADLKRECIERFGKHPNARIIKDDDQICTTEYSRIIPLENGEVNPKLHNTFRRIAQFQQQSHWLQLLHRSDRGFADQRPARLQKFHLLTRVARLYKGYEHPPAFPPHQHPAGPLDLQDPERPHRHTQGETQTQPHTEMSCLHAVISPFGRAKLTVSYLWPADSLLCSHLVPDLSVFLWQDFMLVKQTVRLVIFSVS